MSRSSSAAPTIGKRAAAFGAELSIDEGAQPGLTEDLKLFAITWLGGVVFFGTLIA